MPDSPFDAEPDAAPDRTARRLRVGTPFEPGIVLEWADRIGHRCAARWAGSPCLLVHVGEIRLHHAAEADAVVDAEARVVQTGTTSVQVLVRIVSRPDDGDPVTIATCFLIYVATDANGRPAPVPAWRPSTIATLELGDRAARRAQARAEVRRALHEADPLPTEAAGGVHAHLVTATDRTADSSVAGGRLLRWIHDGALAAASSLTGVPMQASDAIGTQLTRGFRPQAGVDVEARVAATEPGTVHVAVDVRASDAIDAKPAVRGLISLIPVDPTAVVPRLVLRNVAQRRLADHALALARVLDEIDSIGEDEDW